MTLHALTGPNKAGLSEYMKLRVIPQNVRTDVVAKTVT